MLSARIATRRIVALSSRTLPGHAWRAQRGLRVVGERVQREPELRLGLAQERAREQQHVVAARGERGHVDA